ncbi:hypothetical protein H6P81_013391 [Aristolochia fimbriata]|uniref:Cytochrome P450 n=1 Tax=Aristolochia fimbriata TaxID=158543 RepID=A0AAV7EEK0_ARIFI|nr:hypothetical protein H6P81_013391 [Aristolochia fimbriata]
MTYTQRKLSYGCSDMVFSPYNEYWRQLRKLCTLELFSLKRTQSFRAVREDEIALRLDSIADFYSSSLIVNLSELILALVNDFISRIVFEFQELLATISVVDFFPRMEWIYKFTVWDSKLEKIFWELDTIYDEDVFVGGTDTFASLIIWAMTELMRNPSAIRKLQEELRKAIGNKERVEERDLLGLDYMKAIIKETFRMHPPAPLLVPRETTEEFTLEGYTIPAKAQIFENARAIGHPKYWECPEEFKPERFLNSPIDYKGKHFELIPFGAGRRGCPGINFATPTVELTLANLLHRFDWELPPGIGIVDLDMKEAFGMTTHKSIPLCLVAIIPKT